MSTAATETFVSTANVSQLSALSIRNVCLGKNAITAAASVTRGRIPATTTVSASAVITAGLVTANIGRRFALVQ